MGVPLFVETVRVEDAAVAFPTVTVGGLNEQRGGGLRPPATTQDGVIMPAYPLVGLTVTIDVEVLPGVNQPGFSGAAEIEYPIELDGFTV